MTDCSRQAVGRDVIRFKIDVAVKFGDPISHRFQVIAIVVGIVRNTHNHGDAR